MLKFNYVKSTVNTNTVLINACYLLWAEIPWLKYISFKGCPLVPIDHNGEDSQYILAVPANTA